MRCCSSDWSLSLTATGAEKYFVFPSKGSKLHLFLGDRLLAFGLRTISEKHVFLRMITVLPADIQEKDP